VTADEVIAAYRVGSMVYADAHHHIAYLGVRDPRTALDTCRQPAPRTGGYGWLDQFASRGVAE
jgi:hypothetical protein